MSTDAKQFLHLSSLYQENVHYSVEINTKDSYWMFSSTRSLLNEQLKELKSSKI